MNIVKTQLTGSIRKDMCEQLTKKLLINELHMQPSQQKVERGREEKPRDRQILNFGMCHGEERCQCHLILPQFSPERKRVRIKLAMQGAGTWGEMIACMCEESSTHHPPPIAHTASSIQCHGFSAKQSLQVIRVSCSVNCLLPMTGKISFRSFGQGNQRVGALHFLHSILYTL